MITENMHAGATCLEVYTRYMIRPRNSILSRGIVYAREHGGGGFSKPNISR